MLVKNIVKRSFTKDAAVFLLRCFYKVLTQLLQSLQTLVQLWLKPHKTPCKRVPKPCRKQCKNML